MITGTSNPKVKRLLNLKRRRKAREEEGVFLAEGARMAREAPGQDIRELYVSESFNQKEPALTKQIAKAGGVQPQILSDSVFAHVSDTQTPQGILLVLAQRNSSPEELLQPAEGTAPLLLLLENIQDPGNLGTLFRSAEAAGATGIMLSRDCVDLYNPKVIRSTMGSVYRMPFCYVEDLPAAQKQIRKAGIRVFAADLAGTADYDREDYRDASAFLVGNEGNGLTRKALKETDARVRIPMQGQVESLNASVAGSLLLFEAARQRR